MCRRLSMILSALCSIGLGTLLYAESPAMAELRFEAKGKAEKTAGVWIDGQYVGYVNEVNSGNKMALLPGRHEIIVRQAWYKDFDEQVILEPGEVHVIKLSLAKEARISTREATGELKISATPARAAVFVDDQFAGHVDEFDGVGKAMLLVPGSHRIRIALPGYLPFETVVELRPHQKLKIETELLKGSITEAGGLVSKN
jgi:PEGA domain